MSSSLVGLSSAMGGTASSPYRLKRMLLDPSSSDPPPDPPPPPPGESLERSTVRASVDSDREGAIADGGGALFWTEEGAWPLALLKEDGSRPPEARRPAPVAGEVVDGPLLVDAPAAGAGDAGDGPLLTLLLPSVALVLSAR